MDRQTDRQTVERPIKIIEESSNNHTLETAVCKWSTKQVLSKMLQNSTENTCTRVSFSTKLRAERFLKNHQKTAVPESHF